MPRVLEVVSFDVLDIWNVLGILIDRTLNIHMEGDSSIENPPDIHQCDDGRKSDTQWLKVR